MPEVHSTILAIETSCDETSVAVVSGGRIVSNVVTTQDIHQQYGGVVPELASRAHEQYILPVTREALHRSNVTKDQLNAVAFTQGPGLPGALLVGAAFAKSLACSLDVPLIGVHHMRAHILANFIDKPHPTFPFLGLIVSGGHTQLVLFKDYLQAEVVGDTQDDAAGEALDKIARLLYLPYPGGMAIDLHAKQGDPSRFSFPRTTMPALDFSFSGIKTAVRYFLQRKQEENPSFIQDNLYDLCASIQASLVEMLLVKLQQGIAQTGVHTVVLGGGVTAKRWRRSVICLYLCPRPPTVQIMRQWWQ